jgi:hypothetical protein
VSRGRKVQRHACSVTGTQQYRRMESNSASAPSANGSTGVEAAGKAGERETNAPNLFKAPQAAEERETNAPCPRKTAGTRGHRKPTCRRRRLPPRVETEICRPTWNSNGGRKSRRSTNRPTRSRRRRPSRASHRQQARILVMGQKLEGVGPTYPTPPEPEHQQARLAGVVRPAAGDACGAS